MYVVDSFFQYSVNRGKVILLLVEAIGEKVYLCFRLRTLYAQNFIDVMILMMYIYEYL